MTALVLRRAVRALVHREGGAWRAVVFDMSVSSVSARPPIPPARMNEMHHHDLSELVRSVKETHPGVSVVVLRDSAVASEVDLEEIRALGVK